MFSLISEKEHVSNVIFSHKNAWLGVKVQVHYICYVYNNLHCYVYNIFKYIVSENTGKNSHCQKALFISSSSRTGGESRRGDRAVTPIAFQLIFQQLYVYNNHIVMFIMFWNTSSQGNIYKYLLSKGNILWCQVRDKPWVKNRWSCCHSHCISYA